MVSYTYKDVAISDLAVVAIKIERTVGVTPIGLSDVEDTTTVMFTSELTKVQKDLLDLLMVETGVDLIPANIGNTVYTISDLSDNRTTLSAESVTTFTVYPTAKGYEVHFNKVLNNTEKRNFQTLYAGTLVLKQ